MAEDQIEVEACLAMTESERYVSLLAHRSATLDIDQGEDPLLPEPIITLFDMTYGMDALKERNLIDAIDATISSYALGGGGDNDIVYLATASRLKDESDLGSEKFIRLLLKIRAAYDEWLATDYRASYEELLKSPDPGQPISAEIISRGWK